MQSPDTQDRVPDARLPRRGDAAREGDRRAPGRLQPQRRGRAAAVSGRAPRLALAALAARAANALEMGEGEVVTKSGLMVGLGETHDEMVEAFGRPARGRRLDPHRRPVPAPDRAPPAGRALLGAGGVRGAREGGVRAGVRAHRGGSAGALVATTRTSTSSRTGPASGRWPPFSRHPSSGGYRSRPMIPLRDNIPTTRPPVVTYALIAANVLVYFFWQRGGLTLGDPSNAALHLPAAGLRGDPVRVHAPGRPGR